jgi:cyclopropane fatty-acyl-phospholipid synthase-like methyltransferase
MSVATSVPERVRLAVEVLDVEPSDRLLEIGPGPGVAVALIGDELVDGHLVAIDRSVVAARRTLERNRAHVAAEKVTVRHISLEEFDGRGGPFDKIFAINVNLFWARDAAVDLEKIARLLAPAGVFYLFYEAPDSTKGREISDRIRAALMRADFNVSLKDAKGLLAISARRRSE